MIEEDFSVAGEVVLFESGGDRLGVEQARELRDERLSLDMSISSMPPHSHE